MWAAVHPPSYASLIAKSTFLPPLFWYCFTYISFLKFPCVGKQNPEIVYLRRNGRRDTTINLCYPIYLGTDTLFITHTMSASIKLTTICIYCSKYQKLLLLPVMWEHWQSQLCCVNVQSWTYWQPHKNANSNQANFVNIWKCNSRPVKVYNTLNKHCNNAFQKNI